MSRTRNLVFIVSIIMLLSTMPATAQEPTLENSPVTEVLSQMVEDVLSWFDGLLEPPQNDGTGSGGGTGGDNEFSPMIEPGG